VSSFFESIIFKKNERKKQKAQGAQGNYGGEDDDSRHGSRSKAISDVHVFHLDFYPLPPREKEFGERLLRR